MLKITTTNGDTLIHADQQPDAMTIQAYDGSRVLVHGGMWGNHKYIRKEGNKYIYPEDLQNMNGSEKRAAKKVNKAIEKRDKQFAKEGAKIQKNIDSRFGNGATQTVKQTQQITSAHQGSTAANPNDSFSYMTRVSDAKAAKAQIEARKAAREERAAKKRRVQELEQIGGAHGQSTMLKKDLTTLSLEKRAANAKAGKAQIEERRERKRKSIESQQKSAHAGYEADKKFPEGGSTEELERQKEKTKARKTQKRVRAAIDKKLNKDNHPKSREKRVVEGGSEIKKRQSTGGSTRARR